jgi:beta-barrel assembly-enhancing protease
MRRSPRLVIAGIILLVGIMGYFANQSINPVTGEKQYVAMSPQQEIALGLNSAPQMAAEFGGLDPQERIQQAVQAIGARLVRESVAGKTDYRFSFHVLADRNTVNAFALPGGPVFITRALLDRLPSEAAVAGVLGHEVGHVVARHSSEHIAKSQLGQSIIGAVGVAASDDYRRGQSAAMVAAMVTQMVQMRYGRNDELESDRLGVQIMSEARYDPRALLNLMKILEEASSGRSRQPEFMSTHPDPGNRLQHIEQEIARRFPNGVPDDFKAGNQPMREGPAEAR